MEKDASTEGISFADDINKALAVLKNGGIILYPTDTVWGIGCDASNTEAVERVYRLKARSDAKALITLVADEAMLEATVDDIPEAARQIVAVATSPVTIVYDRPHALAPNLRAADGSAAVRITSESFSHGLCKALGRAIVSTSANISGRPTPQCFDEIDEHILQGVDYVAQAGRQGHCTKPSSVIKVDSHGRITIIRP